MGRVPTAPGSGRSAPDPWAIPSDLSALMSRYLGSWDQPDPYGLALDLRCSSSPRRPPRRRHSISCGDTSLGRSSYGARMMQIGPHGLGEAEYKAAFTPPQH